jgi:malate dehydrogenase (quinone)
MTAKQVDVLLIGAGAMSSTLGMLLKQLDPSLKMAMVEKLDQVAQESTDALNNAGTGHAAYCELNYTPQREDGSIDTTKAMNINSAFEQSLQFWSYLVEEGSLPAPQNFINPAPHCSFVWGDENVAFLRKRYETLSEHHLFSDMEYTEDPARITEWMPLVMQSRKEGEKVAATRVAYGSDVNFGELSRCLVNNLTKQDDFDLHLNHFVENLKKNSDGSWQVVLKDTSAGQRSVINSKFVFIGAGGAALTLLQKSGIKEGKGYGGFPVSGQWLICNNPEIIEQHNGKVYGKPPLGAPPMSVPHLDTRIINGKKALLFGPFAGFTTKFLKKGSFLDLPLSIKPNNLSPLMSVGFNNMDLTRYLISESLQSHSSRVKALSKYFPEAKEDDWQLSIAGQRVQIIKKNPQGGGKLEFGTEVIVSEDHSVAALLGASPGASTAVQAMMTIVERAFPKLLASDEGQRMIKAMIPSYGETLAENAELLKKVRARTLETLQLQKETSAEPARGVA